MDSQNIKGCQDYKTYYHMSTEGLVWLDGKGNPILLLHKLGTHVEAMDPFDLWNFIQTQNKKHTVPSHRSGPSNSIVIDPNTPP